MKNEYRVVGADTFIRVRVIPVKAREVHGEWLETVVDTVELPMLMAMNCTWYAQQARSRRTPSKKFYVLTKLWEPGVGRRNLYLHRAIAGEPRMPHDRAAEEIHHEDTDGLNNRRLNLDWVTHRGNQRAHIADPEYWEDVDAKARRVHVFKRLVGIGNEVGAEFGVGRQAMHRIRVGKTRRGAAMAAYWERVVLELPELFKAGDERYPHLVVREFTAVKGESGVGRKPAVAPRVKSGRLVSCR